MRYETLPELVELCAKEGGFRVRLGNEWYIKINENGDAAMSGMFLRISTGDLIHGSYLAGAENNAVAR